MEKKVVYRIATIADYDREALSSSENACSGLETKEVNYSNLVVVG